MDAEVLIRGARESDSEAIAALLAELGYPNSPDFVSQKIQQLSRSTANPILVAIMNSRVVGVASLHVLPLFHEEGNLCRVTALVVAERCRGKGVGRKLIESAEAIARSNRCVKIEVTTGDHRLAAHAFYRTIGYEEVSRRLLKSI